MTIEVEQVFELVNLWREKFVSSKLKKDLQTVTASGDLVADFIEGVVIHYPKTHPDERGDLCEIYNPAWELLDAPLVYVYQVSVRPGKVRGWVVHQSQDDRLFVSLGTLKIVLYDAREDSATMGKVNEIYLSEYNRGIVVIPRGVFHAIQNVGDTAGLFINMPTEPYSHEDPDKFRLPPNNEVIPYRFEDRIGW